MKGSTTRYTVPLSSRRPPGARLLEAFSPKLSRRVRLFDQASFNLWISLEADAKVVALCERPTSFAGDAGRMIDFWVRRDDGEELLLLERSDTPDPAPQRHDGLAVRLVTAADLAAQSTWIDNWHRMLTAIVATRGLLPKSLKDAVLRRVREPVALSLVEHELSTGDPSLIRGAIFGQGFHARVQQLRRHARCPIHCEPLQVICRRCDRPSAYRLDAQLLDAPFKCRHCRAPYSPGGAPRSPARWALAKPERAAIARASLSLPP